MKDTVFSRSTESGLVFDPKGAPKATSGTWKCIPHSRCVVGDLLTPDGTLTIKVKIDLLGENCPGGIQEQLTGLKRKLYTELTEMKSKLRKIKSDPHWPSFFLAIDNNDANDDDGDGGDGGDGNGDDHDDAGGDGYDDDGS